MLESNRVDEWEFPVESCAELTVKLLKSMEKGSVFLTNDDEESEIEDFVALTNRTE